MIVEQFRPQAPDTDNELHQLQLMRVEARRDADKAWRNLRRGVQDVLCPKPARQSHSLVSTLLSHAQTIATGAMVGARIVTALRRIANKK